MVATELAPTQMKKERVFGEINDKAGGQQKPRCLPVCLAGRLFAVDE